MVGINLSSQKQTYINQQYNKIYAHEAAHKAAAGKYGGSIVIEKNSEGIPFAGHVSIQMPTLDKNNPQKTIDHAQTVINAAMAPGDPSSQDYKVAAQARAILSEAQAIKGKKLNYLA